MKLFFLAVALLSCAASAAPQKLPPSEPVRAQPVSAQPITTMQAARDTRPTAATRHLTEAQRAELRMQLYQFNLSVVHRPPAARP